MPTRPALVVGLTGGVASGKSAAAAAFESRGVSVVDTDRLAREVAAPGAEAIGEIRRTFGDDVLDAHGGLDRRAMRRLVFEDEGARRRLEAILHPRIAERLESELAAIRAPWCIVAIPLLVEAGWVERVDRVLVVDAAPERQLTRLMERDGMDEASARRVIDAQASREDRLSVAHDVLDNNGSLEELDALVGRLYSALDALARGAA